MLDESSYNKTSNLDSHENKKEIKQSIEKSIDYEPLNRSGSMII